MRATPWLTVILLAAAAAPLTAATPPVGLLAASVGDRVLVLDPSDGDRAGYDTGPVGWLFPAPGGVLYAPDLVHGTTAVIDLRGRRVVERLEGVTMPRFGWQRDRYFVVAGPVQLHTYPERAFIARIESVADHPWRVLISTDSTSMLVIDRPPGDGDAALVAVDLVNRRVSYRRPLEGDPVDMALVPAIRALALADRAGGEVRLLSPADGAWVGRFETGGAPVGVLVGADPDLLAVAVASAEGRGRIDILRLKPDDERIRVRLRKRVELPAPPVRLAGSPEGAWMAVALEDGLLPMLDWRGHPAERTLALPGPARDLIWCDPAAEGPLVPEWSDRRETHEFDFDGPR